jgi:gliding motility-associated-like protein
VGPAELIEDVFIGGGCYEVSGITSTGAAFQNGTFANGLTSIGLEEGVILSTGNINVATGPNNTTSAGTGGGGGGDPDLSQIVGGSPIFDVSIIEFQFEPTDSIITFDYVFASEEYCDWVGSQFNDVFGFFLSGPGINGPYSNNAENIALIPNTTTAVAINSVNHVNNTAFYVGNIPAGSPQFGDPDCAGHPVQGGPSVQDCQFDGYTTVLTAVAEVIPCETYTIKLAIADVFDGLYDSAVFLAANSFNNGGIASGSGVGTEPNTNIIYEGCTGGYFEFVREDGDNSMPLVVTFTISPNSTATPGADYTPIPTTIVIPPGSDNFQLPINVFADGIPEGTESIIIELQNACSCETREIEILIEDPPPIEMDPTEITICEGDDVDLSANASGGVPGNLTYLWSTGANTETVEIVAPNELDVNVEPVVELLLGESYQLQVLVNFPESEISNVEWTPTSGLSCTDCLDPIVTPLLTTTYNVEVTNVNGCLDNARVQFLVDRRPQVYIPNIFSPNGDGDNDIFMIFANTDGVKEIRSFLVFSRWGETVYEYYNFLPNDPAYGWNGNHRGEPMNPAVFAYFAEIEMIDGSVVLYEGDVTLVR